MILLSPLRGGFPGTSASGGLLWGLPGTSESRWFLCFEIGRFMFTGRFSRVALLVGPSPVRCYALPLATLRRYLALLGTGECEGMWLSRARVERCFAVCCFGSPLKPSFGIFKDIAHCFLVRSAVFFTDLGGGFLLLLTYFFLLSRWTHVKV